MNLKLSGRICRTVFALAASVFCGILSDAQTHDRISCHIRVVDTGGQPVPGASVVVCGTMSGETADADGKCVLHSISPDAVLSVSCLGYEDAVVEVASRAGIEIVLPVSSLVMDELVVVGYGSQRKKDLSGAVASVKGDVINEYASLSVANALQGRVSGVQITQLNGQPGAGIQVRIRGANSIKGDNEPLWIIDGFPGDINMVNTSDIESVEILKDASATAIYGSRGANGVVIVTTKRPKDGNLKISYDGSAGVQTLAKRMDMMDAWEYMDYLNEKAFLNGRDPVYSQSAIAGNLYTTDWQNEVFRPAVMTSHAIDVSGGSKKLKSSLGLSYFGQDGIVKNSGYSRLSIRTNLNYDVSKWFSVNANVIYSRSMHDQMNSQGGNRGSSVIGASLIASPLATPHYDDGTWNDFVGQPIACLNPVAYLNEIKNRWMSNRVSATAGFTVRPADGLSISVSANMLSSASRSDYTKSLAYPNSEGAASISFGESMHVTGNNIITYDKNVRKHHFDIMGGVTYEQSISKSTGTGTAYGFISDVVGTYDMDAASIKALPSSSYSDWRLFSFLGRVNYSYDNRYILTMNFRADGSSRYSKGNKWGYFPSAAVAWRLGQEKFMRDVTWIDELKIRAGYGSTGSTAISPYSTQNTLSTENVVFDKNTTVAYVPSNTFKGGLKWETTSQVNAGFDFSMFSERLRITADYYYKRTYDLLNDVEMPRSSGYTTSLRNIGSVQNQGFEFQIDALLVDRSVKWDFGVNFSLNRSRILSLSEGKDIFGATVSNSILSDQLNIMREGEEMFLFYGYVEDGYDEKGNIVYKDIDGEEGITVNDKTIIGNPNPDFLLNFNTSINWRNFTLSAFFQASVGNDIYSLGMADIAYDYGYNGNALREVKYNHWTPENRDAKYPALLEKVSYRMSDRFVYDGSYLRLKNLELSYDIPCGNSKAVSKARVYVSGQNLLTFTRYPFWDPDVNAKGGGNSIVQGLDANCYPGARTFSLGCRLVF